MSVRVEINVFSPRSAKGEAMSWADAFNMIAEENEAREQAEWDAVFDQIARDNDAREERLAMKRRQAEGRKREEKRQEYLREYHGNKLRWLNTFQTFHGLARVYPIDGLENNAAYHRHLKRPPITSKIERITLILKVREWLAYWEVKGNLDIEPHDRGVVCRTRSKELYKRVSEMWGDQVDVVMVEKIRDESGDPLPQTHGIAVREEHLPAEIREERRKRKAAEEEKYDAPF